MRGIMPAENIVFITNEENFYNVFNQIKEIEPEFKEGQILIEPASLNTAPAIAYGIKFLAEKKNISLDAPVLVLPSDHYIGNEEKYLALVKDAMAEAGDNIGTIGITPLKAETGFGYIKKGECVGNHFKVLEFREKPDQLAAEEYFRSGQYVWNSGMYIFSPRVFARELKTHAPEIYSVFTEELDQFLEKFKLLPSISIDFAISEKSDKVVVFEGDFGWSDIGSFDGLAEILSGKDENCRHVGIDSKNIFIHSTNNRLVTTIGVDDLIVVENNDSILIQKKGRSEDVKKIVSHLKENKFKEIDHNLIVYRPWGKYEVLVDSPAHKVKKITVYPGAKLSLQAHYHRAEHWVVVRGSAKIVNGENELSLCENESAYIPAMTKHRLENPGKVNLEIIEVQTGNYLEEDDIIRYDDEYKRRQGIVKTEEGRKILTF